MMSSFFLRLWWTSLGWKLLALDTLRWGRVKSAGSAGSLKFCEKKPSVFPGAGSNVFKSSALLRRHVPIETFFFQKKIIRHPENFGVAGDFRQPGDFRRFFMLKTESPRLGRLVFHLAAARWMGQTPWRRWPRWPCTCPWVEMKCGYYLSIRYKYRAWCGKYMYTIYILYMSTYDYCKLDTRMLR